MNYIQALGQAFFNANTSIVFEKDFESWLFKQRIFIPDCNVIYEAYIAINKMCNHVNN